ncbi:MAG TPA: DNA primase [Streptosporangiaceae bacterium]|nr:DNA primase [Streptosporangiaceae bacterium]
MPGRIRDEDIELVRNRSPVQEVVGEYLQLRNAGGGSLKGLCPFHEEKTPSFNVTPARGLWYCFSCAEGGDVIKFVRKIDNLGFTEAVERLAARAGIELRYEQGGHVPGQEQSQRRRLIEAHRAAADYYAEQLLTPAAAAAREFLSSREFEIAEAQQRFGVGYAPDDWEAATRHLRGRGFTDAELLAGGLAGQGRRGLVDKFRGRLIWPIRDLTGDVIAFGARKLSAEDNGPKYLNTPETPIFKKSSVLYGADLAKRDIAQRRQVVIVEGYTDVMACHLAGVTTAVATSGTSFGDGHIRILRRLLLDTDLRPPEFIFTFDGDSPGQRAALRAFEMEERFVSQTYVAVQPDGLDPCDLRLKEGPAAVKDLVASRVPLYEFTVRSVLSEFDLDTSEGQLAALDATAPIVARIKDPARRKIYAANLDRWIGLLDQQMVIHRVAEHIPSGSRGAAGASGSRGRAGAPHGPAGGQRDGDRNAGGARQPADQVWQGSGGVAADPAGSDAGRRGIESASEPGAGQRGAAGRAEPPGYDSRDPVISLERQVLKLAFQRPALLGPEFDALGAEAYSAPAHRSVRELIAGCGGVATAGPVREWADRLLRAAPNELARTFLTKLAVEPVERADGEPDIAYAVKLIEDLEKLAVSRKIAVVKSRLQRMNPVTEPAEYNRMFGDLVALEQRRRVLLDRTDGI